MAPDNCFPSQGHTAQVLTMDADFSVSWTEDHCQTITGSADFTARLWNLRSGEMRALLEGHTGYAHCTMTFPLYPMLACHGPLPFPSTCSSGSSDLSAATPSAPPFLSAADPFLSPDLVRFRWIQSVCLTFEGEIAVTGSNDHTCRIWDCPSGQCIHTLIGHTGPVNAVAVRGNLYPPPPLQALFKSAFSVSFWPLLPIPLPSQPPRFPRQPTASFSLRAPTPCCR